MDDVHWNAARPPLAIRLTPELCRELEQGAGREGLTLSAWGRELLRRGLLWTREKETSE